MARKKWYRHRQSGQRGYLVETPEGPKIRVDNEAMEIIRPISEGWDEEAELPPINDRQIRIVAFEADRALCQMLGMYGEARKEWIDLRDEERLKWIAKGPPERSDIGSIFRRRLWECITEELEACSKGT